MTWIPEPSVKFSDSSSVDAFSRLRVSNPTALFYGQHQYKIDDLRFDNELTGGGTITHDANEAVVDLNVTTASGDKVIYQTLDYLRYQPGKSQFILMTFVMNTPEANLEQRVGYFNDSNGIFLEVKDASTVQIVRRTNTSGSPVDNVVAQASWNVDSFDGTGPSGKTLDLTKTQILVIDAQWLGVGRVRVGFDIDGIIYVAHEFLNANALTLPYTQSFSLPARFEIETTGVISGAASLKAICVAVSSEGGLEIEIGVPISTSNAGTAVTAASGTLTPILSIRPAATFNSVDTRQISILVAGFSATCSTNPGYLSIIWNGTLSGPTFAAVDATNSCMEKDVVAGQTISGGVTVFETHIPTAGVGVGASGGISRGLLSSLPLTKKLDGTQIPLTIAIAGIGGTAPSLASFNWVEIR
jgi:hypothetical protein